MPMHHYSLDTSYWSAAVCCLVLALISACDSGLTNTDRLQRGEIAYENGEYQAALVDAKRVLQTQSSNSVARVLLGRALLEIGDYAAAEMELRRAIELGVPVSELVVDLGRSLLGQRKYQSLLNDVNGSLASEEDDRNVLYLLLGDARLGLGQTESARAEYAKVLESRVGDEGARLGIAQSYIQDENWPEARLNLELIVTDNPRSALAWNALGQVNAVAGQLIQAADAYDTAAKISRETDNVGLEVLSLYGSITANIEGGNTDLARARFDRLHQVAPENTSTLLAEAKLAFENRDFSHSTQALREILRREENNRPAQLLMGQVHRELGNLEQAEMYVSAVVTAVPSSAQARRLLAEIQVARGQASVARATLSPLMDSGTIEADEVSLIAFLDLLSGDGEHAVASLRDAVSVNPEDPLLKLQLSLALLRAGQNEEATQLLKASNAETEFGSVAARHTLLVLSYLADGKPVYARREAEQFASAYPGEAVAHRMLGIVRFSEGSYDVSRIAFETALERNPGETSSQWFLGKLNELEGDHESAHQRYAEILDRDSTYTMALLGMSSVASARGQIDESVKWLEQARSEGSPNLEVTKQLAKAYLSQGRTDEAENVIAELQPMTRTDAELLNLLGVAQFSQGKILEAEQSFRTALAGAADSETYRFNLSLSQAKLGQLSLAIDTLELADEQVLQSLNQGILLVALKSDVGKLDEAHLLARRLTELHPTAGRPHAMLGELLAQTGDVVSAAREFSIALAKEANSKYALRAFELREQAGLSDPLAPLSGYLEAAPNDGRVRMVYAQALQQRGNLSESISEYERLLVSEPDNFIVANNLAWTYFLSGDSRALRTARLAYGLAPQNSAVVDTLGWLLFNQGEFKESVHLLRRAVDMDELDDNKRFHLAAALESTGRRAEARSILEQIVAGNRHFESRKEAQELLSKL